MDFGAVVDLVAAHIEAAGFRWAVAGGLAVQAHGFSRLTKDLDIVTESGAQAGLVAYMESLGYETVYVSAGFSNHAHDDARMGGVDFIYVEPATADRMFSACGRQSGVDGRTLPVPKAEHLIAMKVHAMKNDPTRTLREMADIQFLMSLSGVDRARVEHYFVKAGLKERYDELLRLL